MLAGSLVMLLYKLRSHHKLCSPSKLPASISCRFSDAYC